jgi:hypothetical protein
MQVKLKGKTLMFKIALYIPVLSKNLLPTSEIIKHNPFLDVIFQGERFFVIDKRSNKELQQV